MKYISLEDLERAKLSPIMVKVNFFDIRPSVPLKLSCEDAAYITGWNDCIEALKYLAVDASDICGAVMSDTIIKTLKDNPPKYADYVKATICTKHDLDQAFLEDLTNAEWEKAIRKDLEAAAASPDIYDDPGIPDCDDCRISGLISED